MSQKLEFLKVIDTATATDINHWCTAVDSARWVRRNFLSTPRAVGNATCGYDFCGHNQMSKELKEKLFDIAPTFDGFPLAETAINRYNVGDYIGQHRDRDLYRLNLVISLQETGDGLMIDDTGEFIEDKLGYGVLIKGVGPVHSVPPVKNIRYSLIYLYE